MSKSNRAAARKKPSRFNAHDLLVEVSSRRQVAGQARPRPLDGRRLAALGGRLFDNLHALLETLDYPRLVEDAEAGTQPVLDALRDLATLVLDLRADDRALPCLEPLHAHRHGFILTEDRYHQLYSLKHTLATLRSLVDNQDGDELALPVENLHGLLALLHDRLDDILLPTSGLQLGWVAGMDMDPDGLDDEPYASNPRPRPVVLGPGGPVPHLCGDCGQEFPWLGAGSPTCPHCLSANTQALADDDQVDITPAGRQMLADHERGDA